MSTRVHWDTLEENEKIEQIKQDYNIQKNKSQCIVDGYIKNVQKLFKTNSQCIPSEISQICLSFYHLWVKIPELEYVPGNKWERFL